MQSVTVRNLTIGEGIPKICVPIVGNTKEQILKEAEEIRRLPVDLTEWRADWFESVFDLGQVNEVLAGLRKILGEIPLLFTFRTSREGGEKAIEPEAYIELNRKVAESGYVNLVDAELFTGDDKVQEIIAGAHACGVKVIVSNHDFEKTPEKEELVKRLTHMQKLGADIPKIAVMPKDRQDVLTLLAATAEVSEKAACPIITMSMAGNGIVSRLCGEVFGSAVTFGAGKKASAPGQIGVEELRRILTVLHGGME